MAEINISVIDPTQSNKTNMAVPDDVDVGTLIEAMVDAMGLPTEGANGRPLRYQLSQRDDAGNLSRLSENKSLAGNRTEQGSILQLTVEMVAGTTSTFAGV